LVTTAVAASVVASGVGSSRVLAQAEANTQPEASPEAVESIGYSTFEGNVAGDTANEIGPAVPPGFTERVTNWPVESGNLKATRAAQGSAIFSANVSQLCVGWRASVPANSMYGSLVSSPVIVIGARNVKTPLLNGGDSNIVTINAPAGTYEYYCSVPGHREVGISGTLAVQ
jgi:hypothetical protein